MCTRKKKTSFKTTLQKDKDAKQKKKDEKKAAVEAQFLSETEMFAMNAANVLDELTEKKEDDIVDKLSSCFKNDVIGRSSCAIDGAEYYLSELTLIETTSLPLEIMKGMYKGPSDLHQQNRLFYDLSNEDVLLQGKTNSLNKKYKN